MSARSVIHGELVEYEMCDESADGDDHVLHSSLCTALSTRLAASEAEAGRLRTALERAVTALEDNLEIFRQDGNKNIDDESLRETIEVCWSALEPGNRRALTPTAPAPAVPTLDPVHPGRTSWTGVCETCGSSGWIPDNCAPGYSQRCPTCNGTGTPEETR